MKNKRGGPRPGAGRKPIHGVNMRKVAVFLAPEHEVEALRIGSSLSDGVRVALEKSAKNKMVCRSDGLTV